MRLGIVCPLGDRRPPGGTVGTSGSGPCSPLTNRGGHSTSLRAAVPQLKNELFSSLVASTFLELLETHSREPHTGCM